MHLNSPQVAAGFYIGELFSKDAERGVRSLLRPGTPYRAPILRIEFTLRNADTSI